MNKVRRPLRSYVPEAILYAILITVAVVWVIPILWAFVASTRPVGEPISRGDVWFGSALSINSYIRVFELAPFLRYFYNTIRLVLMIFGVQAITATLAAFAFAHFRFPAKNILFFLVLTQLLIPTTALLVPNFETIRVLQLYDTVLGIGLPFFGTAFGTFLMRQAFLGIPKSIVDAGIIDGCRWYQLLRHVYLPPSIPTLIAFGIATTSWHWNEFLWPLIITNSSRARPLTAGLVRFTQLGEIGAQWSLLSAATMVVAFPLLLAFLIFQRQFIETFIHTGIK
ncbi:MAG: carbohydrate ABC transporter permease [Spirochaetales bacterium]